MTDQERDRPLKQNSSKLEGLIQLQKRPRFSIIGIWSVTIMVVCLTFWKSAHTQIIPRVNIKGRVIDGSTKKPLFYANVFLANTTRGAATDEDGRFVIDGIPLGTYELVATMMGYDKESKEVIMKEPKDAVVDFQLWPRPFQAPSISIEAINPREWQKNLIRFKNLFIGQSPNAAHCIIKNPEVLDFTFDEASNTFTAEAYDTIEIENRALGYRIYTDLIDFTFRDIAIRYMHQSRYTLLTPENEKESKRWDRNRILAYYGSLRHFLVTLSRGNLEEEGYRVSLVAQLSGTEANRNLTPVNESDIILPGELPFEKKLVFLDYLQVFYTREGQEFESGPLMSSGRVLRARRKVETHQASWLKLSLDHIIFNEAGYLYNPYGLSTYGNWSWERFSDVLPLDYVPE